MLSFNSWVRLRSIAVAGLPASSGTAGPSISHASLLSRLLERIRPSGTCDDDCEHLEDPITAQMTALKPSSEGDVESMVGYHPKEQRLTSPTLHRSAYREAQRCSFWLSRHISQAACSSDVSRRQLHTSCAAHPQQISLPSVGRALFGISTQPQSLLPCSDRPGERLGIPCQLLSRRLPHTDPNTAKRVSEANSILQVRLPHSCQCCKPFLFALHWQFCIANLHTCIVPENPLLFSINCPPASSRQAAACKGSPSLHALLLCHAKNCTFSCMQYLLKINADVDVGRIADP